MAFQLPQVRDPNEPIRRFVSTALAARQQDQNESFQIQKSLLDMDAQQKRKQLLDNAYGQSIQRVASVLGNKQLRGSEVNAQIEGEASKYASVAPELYKALTAQKVKDASNLIVQKSIDPTTGATVEQNIAIDQHSNIATPIGTPRVTDKNTKVLTADTEQGNTSVKKAVTLDGNGKKIASTDIGSEPSKAQQEALKESKLPVEQRSSYRIALEKKNNATSDALKYGKAIDDVNAQIESVSKAGGKSILFENKIYDIGKDTESLMQNFNDKVVQAKKQEGEFQGIIEKMKNPNGATVATPAPTATPKLMKYNPTTKKLEPQ